MPILRGGMRGGRAALGLLLLGVSAAVLGAVSVDVVKTDLEPLIRVAATSPIQFAVHVPYSVSSTTAGTWSVADGNATWRYAARIPTAVSLSFHATPVHLPRGGSLTVRSATTTIVYRASDLKVDFWSRVQPGDSLALTLTVPSSERSEVTFRILSFQAGYRGLGANVPDHPLYRQLMARTEATNNSTCVQNYECNVTAGDQQAARATIALIIGNLYQCSGTLLNDVPGDNTPFVLTARHCETGQLGGGNPGAAATVTTYWDATTPCGQTLNSLYDPNVITQTGATTVVEQQDAWLIRLNESPVVSDAEYIGFDATAGVIAGGYTVQHSLGLDKQFTSWFGQALQVQIALENTNYESDFWEVVNLLGNVGPGASGSALIDQNNHLVGSLTLGRETDGSGYGSCPTSSPSNPNGSNGVADFTSLAATWASSADTSSTTGTTTLKSVLD